MVTISKSLLVKESDVAEDLLPVAAAKPLVVSVLQDILSCSVFYLETSQICRS